MLLDGAYQSQCDVTARLVREHEISYGKRVFVVDIMYDTVAITLLRLYRTFKAARPLATKNRNNLNAIEAEFIDALRLHFEKYQNQCKIQSVDVSPVTAVPFQCPFTA